MKIAYNTVDTHRNRIYRKLGVQSIHELVSKYKSKFEIQSSSIASVEKPLIITLGYDEPWGYKTSFYPFTSKNNRIFMGDSFNFSYSFKSDIDLELVYVNFLDITKGEYVMMSSHLYMKNNVLANTEYNGTVTLIATNTANNTNPNANLITVLTKPYGIQPTLTFTKFELVKNN